MLFFYSNYEAARWCRWIPYLYRFAIKKEAPMSNLPCVDELCTNLGGIAADMVGSANSNEVSLLRNMLEDSAGVLLRIEDEMLRAFYVRGHVEYAQDIFGAANDCQAAAIFDDDPTTLKMALLRAAVEIDSIRCRLEKPN